MKTFSKKIFCDAIDQLESMCISDRLARNRIGVQEWVPTKWIRNYYNLISSFIDEDKRKYLNYYCWVTNFGHRKIVESSEVIMEGNHPLEIVDAENLWSFIV